MKLNFSCIRDVLILLEEKLQYIIPEDITQPDSDFEEDEYDQEDTALEYSEINFSDICNSDQMQMYTKSDVAYTLIKMEEAGLIIANIQNADNAFQGCAVSDITFTGHELLNNIRPKDNWAKLQSAMKKFGGISVEVVQQLAPILLSSAIQNFIK